jgi:GNAT superfamily N-acetyltransferase
MSRNSLTIQFGDLKRDDAPSGLTLSKLVGWNQSLADWRLLLSMGSAVAARTETGSLIGTTALHSIPPYFWLSMVVVHPAYRSRGIARRLVELALEKAEGAVALDATSLGLPLYTSMGFRTACMVNRMVCQARDVQVLPDENLANISDEAMVDVLTRDREAFGADRSPTLLSLHRRLPLLSRAICRNRAVNAYCLGRRGSKASQIGPLVARNETDALRLIAGAVGQRKGSVVVDAMADQPAFVAGLRKLGFSPSRSFHRMVLGSTVAPGCGPHVFATAGPELG